MLSHKVLDVQGKFASLVAIDCFCSLFYFLFIYKRVLSPIFFWWPVDQKCELFFFWLSTKDGSKKPNGRIIKRTSTNRTDNSYPRSNRFISLSYISECGFKMTVLTADVLVLISCIVSTLSRLKPTILIELDPFQSDIRIWFEKCLEKNIYVDLSNALKNIKYSFHRGAGEKKKLYEIVNYTRLPSQFGEKDEDEEEG